MQVTFLKVMVQDAQSVVDSYLQGNPKIDIKHIAMCPVVGSTPPSVLISIWHEGQEATGEVPPTKPQGLTIEPGHSGFIM